MIVWNLFSFVFNPQLCLHAAGRTKPNGIRDVVVLSFCKSENPFGIEQINDLEKEYARQKEILAKAEKVKDDKTVIETNKKLLSMLKRITKL